MQFDNVEGASFLRTASPGVKAQFEKIWNDDNIPSEGLRTHKVGEYATVFSRFTPGFTTPCSTFIAKRETKIKCCFALEFIRIRHKSLRLYFIITHKMVNQLDWAQKMNNS